LAIRFKFQGQCLAACLDHCFISVT
jgi:hypothetical protein